MDLERFPRIGFTHEPTPLEPLARLGPALGGPRLWVKRDDCTGLATGGNKTRKLDYLMAEAQAQDADLILTQGAVQSNHARQTAAAAAKLGLDCHLLLEERLQAPPTVYRRSGNVFLDELFGASWETRPGGTDMAAALAATADGFTAQGRRVYAIPGGGSNPCGALGYVRATTELLAQADGLGIPVDRIVLASGSAGTHAGVLAGLAALGRDIPVEGVSVRFPRDVQIERVHALAEATAAELGAAGVPRAAVRVDDGHVGEGYGVPTAGMVDAVRRTARLEGLLLDPVYSGKAMAGLFAMVARGDIDPAETVVFLHTGGAVSLFAYDWAFEGEAGR
jgi:L-cysteate sulfo-lyase